MVELMKLAVTDQPAVKPEIEKENDMKNNTWQMAAWKSLDEYETQTANLHNTESPLFKKWVAITNGIEAELFVHEVQNMARERHNKCLSSPEGQAFERRLLEQKNEEIACRDLVSLWAKATGRTGSAHKQSRHGKIRKLIKNGLRSDYARRMMAEAGMLAE